MNSATPDTQSLQLSKPPVVVQILAIIGFTGFAIPVSIIAMDQFGILGMALAAFLAWQWTRLAGIGSDARLDAAVQLLRPKVDDAQMPTGNASFDAYRQDLLNRLETEQKNFQGFLARLRDAKDKAEFDTFLADRERVQRQDPPGAPA